jgi:hypothetical protein
MSQHGFGFLANRLFQRLFGPNSGRARRGRAGMASDLARKKPRVKNVLKTMPAFDGGF